MDNKKKENSIKSLINLYTVVMGVSLSIGISSLINVKDGLNAITPSAVFLFIAFILTIIPFFHGALRHLDDAYIENPAQRIRNGVLIFDFLLLLLHAMAFVVLSLLLQVANHFAWVLVIVLSIDVVWGVFTHFAVSSDHRSIAEWKWAFINFIFCLVICSYLIYNKIFLEFMPDQLGLSFLMMSACLIRTLIDYIWGREFYFPE